MIKTFSSTIEEDVGEIRNFCEHDYTKVNEMTTYFYKEIISPPPSILNELLTLVNLNKLPIMYMYKRDDMNHYGFDRTQVVKSDKADS